MKHNPCDVNPYIYLGNVEGGIGMPENYESLRMNIVINYVINPIPTMLHIVEYCRGREYSIPDFIGGRN